MSSTTFHEETLFLLDHGSLVGGWGAYSIEADPEALSEPLPQYLLDGVEFTVTQVGIDNGVTCEPVDVTDTADWDGLEGLFNSAPAAPADPYCLTSTVQTGVTGQDGNASGQATFDLDLGIYFVEETDSGDNNIVSPVPSFYVSIPTSEGEGGDGWTYDVVADPKNSLMDAPLKFIDPENVDSELVVGADVTWNLSMKVPTLADGETFDSAVITDVLDERLAFVPGSTTASIGLIQLIEGTHFNVDTDGVTWTFTEAGRQVLDDHMGSFLFVSFDTTVLAVGDGSIPNDEYSSEFNGKTVPGELIPYTYYGNLVVYKTDGEYAAVEELSLLDSSNGFGNPLQGAQFQVFDTVEGVCAAEAPETGAIATGTSDADGVVQWEGMNPSNALGLWIGNFNSQQADPMREYCLYETVVPAGHTATPIENPILINVGDAASNIFFVVNPRIQGPDLPLTGAQGTLMMTVGGLLIVAVGTGAIIVARRRANNQNI